MPNYKESLSQFDRVQTADNTTGTRVFAADPRGLITTLPVVGTGLMVASPLASDGTTAGASDAGCLARTKKTNYIDGIETVTFTYSTSGSTTSKGGAGSAVSTNEDDVRYELGSEEVVIYPTEYGSGTASPTQEGTLVVPSWYWDPANDVKVTVPISRSVGINRITRSMTGLSDANVSTFMDRVKTHIKTVNEFTFQFDYEVGQVRFDGATGGMSGSIEGVSTWAFELQFTVRILAPFQPAIVADDWLYLYDPADGTYKKPTNAAGTVHLYPKTNFTDLFAAF